MKGAEIRQSYLDFFRKKEHLIVESASVVPQDDPTLYFTNAGMNQFKPYFLGHAAPQARRIADTQKCIRVQGKHNDLEEVGHDTYHHTLFEMLGNWSFGDYYKKEAITWAWELFTKVWGLPKDRLYATVFGGDERLPADEEAAELWRNGTDIDPSHIRYCGKNDNFWMMGETGPCGPCSEIHIDLTPDKSGGDLVNAGSPLVMELWNLVFIQYNSEADGSLRELPAKHVDTGMGFERACAVLECTKGATDFSQPISNYDTEVFRPIIAAVEKLSGHRYSPGHSADTASISIRVIADHIRMISFAIADGALPSNEGRGYVVRRLLRRAARYGRKIGLLKPFLHSLVAVLEESMGHAFPEIPRERAKIEKIILAEEESFNHTLDRGLHLFEEVANQIKGDTFPPESAFKLYDTFGFPVDLTAVLAKERGLGLDKTAFEQLMEQQKEKARAAQAKHHVEAATEELNLPTTPFLGFDTLESEAQIAAVLPGGAPGRYQLVLSQTPFYAEMGGQVGDQGRLLVTQGAALVVEHTSKKEGVVLHQVSLPEAATPPAPGEQLRAVVDGDRRHEVERHHTATHLLHWALREVLGTAVRQQGSLVAPDRLRFDFTHHEQVKDAELRTIERLINERVMENAPVGWFEIPYTEKPASVVAFFGDKYGEKVRVVKIGGEGSGSLEAPEFDGYSMELCGGCHTRHTGDLGPFRFISEGAIAAGVRRVEASCGLAGWGQFSSDLLIAEKLAKKLGVPIAGLEAKYEALLESHKQINRQLEQSRRLEAQLEVNKLLARVEKVGDVPFLAAHLGERSGEYLRWVADGLKQKFPGVAVLGSVDGPKVALLVSVAPECVKAGLHAGKIIKQLAQKVGGGGGGRPDLAEAGGKDPGALAATLESAHKLISSIG